MVRRTKEEALETRNALLDAAERVFSERGVSRTSLSDVAAAAGVTRGAVYWHFKDKVDLLDAMLCRVMLPMDEASARSGCDPKSDPLGHVRSCLVNVLKRTAADAQSQRVFEIVFHKCEYIEEMAPARDRCMAMRAGYLSEIERGLRNAIKAGQLPAGVRVRNAAVGLHALIDGLIANWVSAPEYFQLEREGENVVDMFLDGLRTGAASTTPSKRTPAAASRSPRVSRSRSHSGRSTAR
jgi:TetR/AcrR family acrAB operon transcriptional repressor